MKKEGQNVVTCKNCGSNKVNFTGSLSSILFITGILFAGVGIWIPIFGWFVMVPIGLIVMLSSIPALFYKKKNFRCVDCKNKFTITKEQYLEYKAAIK
ncbi:hypothetical protein HCB37_04350 [Listeria booriae]|uniref:Uncharacterized protein n=1 Tax=Listeria booriae TaxID=1552123 RepID=A0A7X1A3G8_9LIST|nr:hypothetical protein [Listeria booriae]MBC2263744.1 hypothetical protein [Listeria booriae]MBC2370574.1 hypothetical protein [Listeria booriae]